LALREAAPVELPPLALEVRLLEDRVEDPLPLPEVLVPLLVVAPDA